MYLKCKRLAKKREKKDGVSQVVDLKLTTIRWESRKKKIRVGQSCVFDDKSFTIWMKEKKDGVDWIVDLKISKILKGKWEKNDGFCRVVYLKYKKLAKKREKKDGVSQVVDLKLTKNVKGKQKKKMGVGQSCVFEK